MIPFRALLPFLVMAFGLAWGMIALLVAFPGPIESMFGPVSGRPPMFILAVYSPAIAAIVIVTSCTSLRGLTRYFSRLLLWRCSHWWYAFLLFGIPLIFVLGALAKGTPLNSSFAYPSLSSLLAAMGFMLILGPVEELGWRGVALPLLQQRLAPIWASIVLGLIWGIWHLPAFFVSGTPQSAWGFTPFLIGSVAVSLILTPLFNASGGSILLAALFHFQLNNPLWPDAQPHDTVFFAGAAMIVVWLNRKAMWSRESSVTAPVPPPACASRR